MGRVVQRPPNHDVVPRDVSTIPHVKLSAVEFETQAHRSIRMTRIKWVSQSGITSYSTDSPRSIWSMAPSAANSRSVVMRQSEFSLLVKASETG